MRTALALLAAAVCLPGPVVRAADEAPPWTDSIVLTVWGGPPAGKVGIKFNGRPVAEFDGKPPAGIEIAELIRQGTNELEISLEAGETVPTAGETRIVVSPFTQVSETKRRTGRPLVEVKLPVDVEPGVSCTQTVRFRAEPPTAPSGELKHRYWLVINGPQSSYWVSVHLNGKLLYEAMEGPVFFDVTPYVIEGKNTVEYAAVPTCLARPTDRTKSLELFFSTGEQEAEAVRMTGPPEAYFSIGPRTKKPEILKKLSFRGR